MADPTLSKDTSTDLVAEAVPAKPGVAPREFWMFAAPPPPGYTYNQVKSGSRLLPDSLATFQNWKPLRKVEKTVRIESGGSGSGSTSTGYRFVPIEEVESGLSGSGWDSVAIPSTWAPVHDAQGNLTGYMVPPSASGGSTDSGGWPKHYGPIAYMTYARFPGTPVEPNGYPISDAAQLWGEFDIPTVHGIKTFRFTFVKRSDGQWVRDGGGDPLPPYVVEDRRTTSRIAVMADFPGSPAVAGTPAEYRTNFHVGWNAGAESTQQHDGDCFVRFYSAIDVAGAVGLAGAGAGVEPGRYERIAYAFYFDLDAAGASRVSVVEGGRRRTGYWPCTPDTKLVIAREDGAVRYEIDDQVIHQSQTPSGGALKVISALYRGEDGVY